MTFYLIKEEMGRYLNHILGQLYSDKNNYFLKDIAITWINYKRKDNYTIGKGYGIQNNLNVYPASIVKLVYGLAAYIWIEQDRILFDNKLNEAVYKMLAQSSNDATSFVIDLLTGTTSGPSLQGHAWDNWKYQREIINDWLSNLNWEELSGTNCCQKTWEDSPFGREKDFYGLNNENKNSMSTDAAARIMKEIMTQIDYKKGNLNLKDFLFRKIDKENLRNEPNNQIEGFLGEGLPDNIPFWSKAGLMSKVRHDAAWWSNDEMSETLLVVFGNNGEFVKDKFIFPQLSKAIYEFNKNYEK